MSNVKKGTIDRNVLIIQHTSVESMYSLYIDRYIERGIETAGVGMYRHVYIYTRTDQRRGGRVAYFKLLYISIV